VLPDGSCLSQIDDPSQSVRLTVRIIEADLDVHGADGTRIGDSYRLITTLTDWRRYPVGLDYSIWPGQLAALGSSLGDLLGRIPARTLPAQLPGGTGPA
jgi:hypothetical protein